MYSAVRSKIVTSALVGIADKTEGAKKGFLVINIRDFFYTDVLPEVFSIHSPGDIFLN